MTPEQKIKWAIVAKTAVLDDFPAPKYPYPEIDELYDKLSEDDMLWDALNEIREGEIETNLPCEGSRHYESKSVAMKMPDSSWVGWTYWYGGGKHGEPEAIDWMEDAYDVGCVEEEKMVVVQTFSKL